MSTDFPKCAARQAGEAVNGAKLWVPAFGTVRALHMPWRSTTATDDETPPAVARTAAAAFASPSAAAVESRSGRERSDIVPFVAAKGDRSERTPSWGRRPYHRYECPEVTKPTSVPANWAPYDPATVPWPEKRRPCKRCIRSN